MSKERTLITIGILIIISPFIGIPFSWFAVILPALGALVLIIAHLMRKEHAALERRSPLVPSIPGEGSESPSPIA